MDPSTFEQDLEKAITGDIHFDEITRLVYSADASIYEIIPLAVVIPKTSQEVQIIVQLAGKYGIPITPRGAATGITGGCLGKGLIIDTSKYLNRILDINYVAGYAICEPGVIQDDLNAALAKQGYRLGPDTSTGNRATLGGMVANNSAGARSLRYGKMVDHVIGLDIVLSNGETVWFHTVDETVWHLKCRETSPEGLIYREMLRIRDQYRKDIDINFPKIPRRVSGYNLDELIKPGPFNPCKLIVGSEGTLGVVTKIKVKICKCPKHVGLLIIHFDTMANGMKAIAELLSYTPLSLEMIDQTIMDIGKLSPSMKNRMGWMKGHPEAVFMLEFEEESQDLLRSSLALIEAKLKKQQIGYAITSLTEKEEMENVWALRKAGLGLLLSKRTNSSAIAFIEDLSVAPEKLPSFFASFQKILAKENKQAGIYGHVGAGCIHVRPFIDLHLPEELKTMTRMMGEVSDLILEHGGALSGEHGDGLVRSWTNKKMFGDRIYQAFIDLKTAFDPMHLMNPGKIIYPQPFLSNLRLSPETSTPPFETFLDFSNEGGFSLSVDMCNGNGLCRKKEGLMCPSFQATGNEYDTTRARATALRAMIHEKIKPADFTNSSVLDVLDLCLECKGCKTECPSQVDMAKMKGEFLYQYGKAHGFSLRSRLFAHIGWINSQTSLLPQLFNYLKEMWITKRILQWVGISQNRKLPSLALERFSEWIKKNNIKSSVKRVVLYNDTYNEFNHPEVGQAAVKILNALGYQVIVPEWECCGRPMISKGFLKEARQKGEKLIDTLHIYAESGTPIVFLEPSCLSAVTDDYKGLLGANEPKLQLVIKNCLSFDQFLEKLIDRGEFTLSFKDGLKSYKFHGHCHQKVLEGTGPTLKVLRAIPGAKVLEIDSGCCGMAGSFGYEKEHEELSRKIGELKLFPAIRSESESRSESRSEETIVANGFSCQCQIEHGTGRKAKHLAVALAEMMK